MHRKEKDIEDTQESPLMIVYHVFSDEKDLWTQDYRFARKLYAYWRETTGAAHLYKEVYANEAGVLNNDMLEAECLLSYGPLPW